MTRVARARWIGTCLAATLAVPVRIAAVGSDVAKGLLALEERIVEV